MMVKMPISLGEFFPPDDWLYDVGRDYLPDTYQTFPEPHMTDEDTTILNDDETSSFITLKPKPKSVEDWKYEEISDWILKTYDDDRKDYESVNLYYFKNLSGSDLVRLSEEECMQIDKVSGRWLFTKIKLLTKNPQADYESSILTDYFSSSNTIRASDYTSQSSGSDGEAEPVQHKKRGRPRSLNKVRRKPEHKTGRLWEFLRDLLLNPEYCPHLICWENPDEGVFRFVSSDKVAKLWGSKRGNNEMNYEKLSRAMRYYYRTKVLQPVLGKRLVYKFGPNAKGWRPTNPNFLLK